MTLHPQIKIFNSSSRAFVGVDEKLAPLLVQLWRKDIDTVLSCQENKPLDGDPVVWIRFADVLSAKKFLETVASQHNSEPDSLYQRVKATYIDIPGAWRYDIDLVDTAVDYGLDAEGELRERPDPDGKPNFVFEVDVRFPLSDLHLVEEAFGGKTI